MTCKFKAMQERALNNEVKLKRTSLIRQFDLVELLKECSELFREMQPIKRKAFLCHVVEDLLYKQEGICPLCSKQISLDKYDVDHIIPWSWGGGNEKGNLQITHQSCNRSKGNKIENISDLVDYFEDRIMNF